MKSEDEPPAGQAGPRPSLPDTSKELLRKLAEELLLLHGQAEAAEERATAAEARSATLQQQLDEARAAAANGHDQQPLADARRRAREAERVAAAARSEAASLQVQLIDSQQQLAAARQRTEEAEAQLAEAQRQADAARLQAARAVEEAAAAVRELQEAQSRLADVQQQLQEQARGPASASPSRAAQRPEDVLTLRAKLNEERRLRKKAEGELGSERRQRQAAQALADSLLDRDADGPDDAAQQLQHPPGLPPPAEQAQTVAAAAAPEGVFAQPRGHDGQRKGQALSTAAQMPHIVVDLAADDDVAAAHQLRQHSGSSSGQRAQHSAASSEDGFPDVEVVGGAVDAPTDAAAAQRQPPRAGSEGVRLPPLRVGRLRGPMQAAGPAHAAVAAGPASASPAMAQHRKRQAEGAAGEAPASAPAPASTTALRRPGSGGAMPKRHRAVTQASPSSPGESALGVAAVLGRQLRRNSSAAAAAAVGASGGIHRGSSLLLKLAAAGDQEEDEEDGSGGRRGGRRSAAGTAYSDRGGSGGGVVLKAGESAKDWLNRSAATYVGTLASNRDFAVFRKPVDASQVPDYPDVVARPMDLGTIRAKAVEGRYRSPREFQSDLQLVVSNAQLYNESPRHPVHQAATHLMEVLEKPHSFYSKVTDQFRQAEMAATLAEEKARQEAEIEALERQLAEQVHPGLNLAVYAEDDEQGNKYFLMRATKPTLTLTRAEVDDFGNEYKRGDTVVVGHYYDYWLDDKGKWDRNKRPYYLQLDKTGYVPASSLLLVDFELRPRKEPEVSPYSGQEERVYEAGTELHKSLRRQIKKMTAEPAVPPRSP